MVTAEQLEASKRIHCGNLCPLDGTDVECPREHWCYACGDCLYCYSEDTCAIAQVPHHEMVASVA